MKRLLPFAVLAAALGFALHGCIFSPSTVPPKGTQDPYAANVSPDSVVYNLANSYKRKEIKPYAQLLSRDYIFRFQSGDVPPELGRDFWTHDEDSTGTEHLFNSTLVQSIKINLEHGAATVPTEIGMPEGSLKLRLSPIDLEVDQTDGTTWVVQGDIQDMFFRKGMVEAGEDTTRWYLFEWRDIPGAGTAPSGGLQPKSSDPDTRYVTMGELLQHFAKAGS